ncbi:MAG TPA: exodeoxyribonuclease VII large subunit [Anaerolineae bacterium]|nr:exodeoxyribonuclease VII large subunit [Anaerolineae bacterium]HQH37510.1 exodeoxyribonuclease VII large subunit [Anaerolineae bacterium]
MWDQLGLFSPVDHPYTVSEITGRIRVLLEQEPLLQDVWIEGEVSNFSRASSGHLYFTLKDAGAQINSVVWRSQAQGITYMPRSGDQVIVHGRIGLYEQGGRYQIYVDAIQPAGRGSLFQEFERLKAQLEAEGLFTPERKRPLPAYPQRIGVVTSPTAAAFRDVINVLTRRYPLAEVLLSPTLVQGETAPAQIVAALAALNARDDVDVILIVRGGGSLEDLWAFNDERVARAVAASRLPVISGVGHETDFTLTDFAADRRAPTPSAAAEMATPDRIELQVALQQHQTRLVRIFDTRLQGFRDQVTRLSHALQYLSPAARLANSRQRVDDLLAHADAAVAHRMVMQRQQVQGLSARLASLNPDAVLARGYAIVQERESGNVITSAKAITPGLALTLRLQDGEAAARGD